MFMQLEETEKIRVLATFLKCFRIPGVFSESTKPGLGLLSSLWPQPVARGCGLCSLDPREAKYTVKVLSVFYTLIENK